MDNFEKEMLVESIDLQLNELRENYSIMEDMLDTRFSRKKTDILYDELIKVEIAIEILTRKKEKYLKED